MLAFSGGSAEAFAELFSRYKQPLFGFFRRRVADPAQAEELTQESFLTVLRASLRYRPRALFRTCLYAVGLKNSRETERRFRSILQQRTGNVVEVLQVEEDIARVRGDIERMEAEQSPPAPSVSIRAHNSFVTGYHKLSETILGILLFFASTDSPQCSGW